MYTACTVDLQFNEKDCLELSYKNRSDLTELESKVQPLAANMLLMKNIGDVVISIVFTLFIGPWTDKYGRRPVLILTAVGFFLSYATLTILSLLTIPFSAWFYIFAFGFSALSGGHITFFVAIYSYVADISTPETRSKNLLLLEIFMSAGIVTGFLSSSYVYAWCGTTIVMLIATISSFIVALWNIFILEESRKTNIPAMEKFKGLFSTKHLKDMVHVFIKRRAGIDRGALWILLATLGLTIAVQTGTESVLFLFVRERFQWDVRAYTLYSAISTLCIIISNLVIIYGIKTYIRLTDEALAVLSFISSLMGCLTIALATESWHMYLSIGLSFLSGAVRPMVRSIVVKITKYNNPNNNEIGKIFSITAAFEGILPMFTIPMYIIVYKRTLVSYTGAFSFISSAIWGFCALSALIAFQFQNLYRRRESYEQIGL